MICLGVPPLEDMTEMLRSISDIKQTRATMSEQLPKSEFLEPAENPEEAKMKRVRKLLGKEDREEEKQQTVNSFPSHQAALVTKQKVNIFHGSCLLFRVSVKLES